MVLLVFFSLVVRLHSHIFNERFSLPDATILSLNVFFQRCQQPPLQTENTNRPHGAQRRDLAVCTEHMIAIMLSLMFLHPPRTKGCLTKGPSHVKDVSEITWFQFQ